MAVPETFKAAVIPQFGAQNVVTSRSLPPIEPDEVSIKITATAINPIDWKMQETGAFIPEYPAVLGSEAAGEIVQVGSNVSDLTVGDRVFFQGILDKGYASSTFQQYCKMPAVLVSKTPDNISDEQAAGVQLATMAVTVAFYDSTGFGLPPPWEEGGETFGHGKAIVVIGGSSSVGQYAIQMARLSGFERIITNASPVHTEKLKSLGAHVVLDRRTQSTPESFHGVLDGLPLPLVFDSIGTESTLLLDVGILQLAGAPISTIVRPCGGIMEDFSSLAAGHGGVVPVTVKQLLQSQKDHVVEVKSILGMGSFPHLRYLSEPLVKHLGGKDGYISRGLFVPNKPLVVPGGLSAVEVALSKNKQGVSGEKVIIRLVE